MFFIISTGVSIATPPESSAVARGGSITLTVLLNNAAGVTFQWFRGMDQLTNTGPYSGVTTDHLDIITGDNSLDEEEYSVRLSRSGPESCTIFSPTAIVALRE